MDTFSIIAFIGFGLLIWYFVNDAMKTWYRRNQGTGKDVDLDEVGHRGSWSGGDVEPDTVTKLERELKEQAEQEESN